jgi:Fe-S cluster biogenesis protein NfuA
MIRAAISSISGKRRNGKKYFFILYLEITIQLPAPSINSSYPKNSVFGTSSICLPFYDFGYIDNLHLFCYINKKESVMLEEKVKSALDNVRPSLQADGGDVEFVSVTDDGTVSVKLTGACGGCPMAQMTLKMGIENYLKKEIPQVTSVVGV